MTVKDIIRTLEFVEDKEQEVSIDDIENIISLMKTIDSIEAKIYYLLASGTSAEWVDKVWNKGKLELFKALIEYKAI